MDQKSVTSSYIDSVGYDESKKLLEITLRSGEVYRYKEVPEDIYKGILRASSPKTYFKEHIRDAFQKMRS